MAPHSSTFAWKIPRTEELGRLQSMGSRRVGHDWATSFHFSLSGIGEGNGNLLQCSCLENPRDGESWWAAVYGSHRVGHDWSDLAATAAAAAAARGLIAFMLNNVGFYLIALTSTWPHGTRENIGTQGGLGSPQYKSSTDWKNQVDENFFLF